MVLDTSAVTPLLLDRVYGVEQADTALRSSVELPFDLILDEVDSLLVYLAGAEYMDGPAF